MPRSYPSVPVPTRGGEKGGAQRARAAARGAQASNIAFLARGMRLRFWFAPGISLRQIPGNSMPARFSGPGSAIPQLVLLTGNRAPHPSQAFALLSYLQHRRHTS